MDEQELLGQFHHNQSLWLARLATGELHPPVPGRRIQTADGSFAVMPGRSGVVMLPMNADLDTTLAGHAKSLVWMREMRARDLLVWSMNPNPPLDLRLLAQGYRVGFEPWWMTRDLTAPIDQPEHTILPATEYDIEALLESDIPYVVREQVPAMRHLLQQPGAPQVVWLVAHAQRQVVGHAIVHMDGGHAGLFNVGVTGRYRHRGVGMSLTLASMQVARDLGANTMNLNSTPMGKNMYQRAGFVQVGVGQTWNRIGPSVHRDAPLMEQRIAMAVGTGNIADIHDVRVINTLSCGLTSQELAARFGQVESLRYLINQGQVPDIISLWRTGLRDEAIAAAQDARARELVTGTQRAYPIHHAVEMGAGTLVLALIDAGASLKSRDGEYNATPLDWAHATNKPTIARIIHRAGGR